MLLNGGDMMFLFNLVDELNKVTSSKGLKGFILASITLLVCVAFNLFTSMIFIGAGVLFGIMLFSSNFGGL